MFTGIVQDLGRVVSRESRGVDVRLTIATRGMNLGKATAGDSICVQGVCLTATSLDGNTFTADVSNETLSLTTLGELQPGATVNLEPALRAGDPLGGHLVSGHVDGIGTVSSIARDGDSLRVICSAPEALSRYIARKGSVT